MELKMMSKFGAKITSKYGGKIMLKSMELK